MRGHPGDHGSLRIADNTTTSILRLASDHRDGPLLGACGREAERLVPTCNAARSRSPLQRPLTPPGARRARVRARRRDARHLTRQRASLGGRRPRGRGLKLTPRRPHERRAPVNAESGSEPGAEQRVRERRRCVVVGATVSRAGYWALLRASRAKRPRRRSSACSSLPFAQSARARGDLRPCPPPASGVTDQG